MYSLNIKLDDHVTPMLHRIGRGLGAPLLNVIGRTGRNVVKEHLEGLDRDRHRPYVAHHFYASAARATNYRISSGGAEVVINQVGIAQRYHGGEIRAVKGKLRLLHIPVAREAEGRTPREFTGLTWIVNRKKRTGVVKMGDRVLKKRTGVVKMGDRVLFALTEAVNQKPDPSVIPDEDTLSSAINTQVASYVNRMAARAGAQ